MYLILPCLVLCAGFTYSSSFEAVSVLPRHCGYSTVHPDTLGDYNASMGSWPWVALLYYQGDFGELFEGCAGSLIADEYILTGAHCVQQKKLSATQLVKITLGEHNTETAIDEEAAERGLRSSSSGTNRFTLTADQPQDFTVSKILIHPDFKRTSQGLLINDVAIIKLDRPANITTWVRPICLPEKFPTFSPGKRVFLAGWGKPDYYSDRSTILRHVRLPLLSTSDCVASFYRRYQTSIELDSNYHMCAGGEVGKDACDGDGGGPLMEMQQDGRWVLIGTVSFGQKICGEEGIPSIYTNMHTYVKWIEDTIRKDQMVKVSNRRENGRTYEKIVEGSSLEATTQKSITTTTEAIEPDTVTRLVQKLI